MKARDPTKFFINQEKENLLLVSKEKVEGFTDNLIDLQKCIVCRRQYDLKGR